MGCGIVSWKADRANARGKKIHVHVTPTLRIGSDGKVEGLVLLMEEEAV
jgi:hypothetical protein